MHTYYMNYYVERWLETDICRRETLPTVNITKQSN